MGILDNFEKGLERVVGGVFARTFKSGLQPLEITAALRRELDTTAAVVARDRILAPNEFTVRLSPSDYERMTALGRPLVDEFVNQVRLHAEAQHYAFAGGLSLRLALDPQLAEGVCAVDSAAVKGEVVWTPVIEVAGQSFELGSRTSIGRGSEADITINDTGASRRHAEVLWDGRRAQLNDLGSTNGTKLDGRPVSKAVLEPDSVIEIGRSRLTFRVLPQAAGADRMRR